MPGDRIRAGLDWARSAFQALGDPLPPDPEAVRLESWASLFRYDMPSMRVFLKIPAASRSMEASVAGFAASSDGDAVAVPLALDPDEGFMLTPDYGSPIRDRIGATGDASPIAEAMRRWSIVQIMSTDPQAGGLALADASPIRMAALAGRMVHDPRLSEDEGLSGDEIGLLGRSLPRIEGMWETLERTGLPLGLEHGDLHDGNMLSDGGPARITDFGEASRGHPLLSMAGCLISFRRCHPPLRGGAQEQAILEASLEPWRDGYDASRIAEAADMAMRLSPLATSACLLGLVHGDEPGVAARYPGRVARALRSFLRAEDRRG